MINKNNKNFQITLDPESTELLKSLAERFKTSKSIIIQRALKVYASRTNHVLKILFSTLQEVEQTEQITNVEDFTDDLEETIRIAKTPWLDNSDDE